MVPAWCGSSTLLASSLVLRIASMRSIPGLHVRKLAPVGTGPACSRLAESRHAHQGMVISAMALVGLQCVCVCATVESDGSWHEEPKQVITASYRILRFASQALGHRKGAGRTHAGQAHRAGVQCCLQSKWRPSCFRSLRRPHPAS